MTGRIRMRWYHKAAIICAGLLVAAGAGGLAYYHARSAWDEPPPDDADLLPDRAEVPDDRNAFTLYAQALEVLQWPGYTPPPRQGDEESTGGPDVLADGKISGEELEVLIAEAERKEQDPAARAIREKDERLQGMVGGETWDEALAGEVLEANRETFRLIDEARSRAAFQLPAIRDFAADAPGLSGFLSLSHAVCLRIQDRFREGDEAGAFEEAVALARLGHRIQCGGGTLVTCLTGSAVQRIGHNLFADLVSRTSLPAERLAALGRRLKEFEDAGPGFADSLRGVYRMCVNTLDDLRRGVIGIDGTGDGGKTPTPIPTNWTFKPNQTRRLFAEWYRPAVAACGMHRANVHLPDPHAALEAKGFLGRLGENAVGRTLVHLMMPATKAFIQQKCWMQTHGAMVRTLAALRCYQMDHGTVPAALHALVPAYLAAVPVDDFDGKPIRYSREKRIVYSVGPDLEDQGGFTAEEVVAWAREEHGFDGTDEDALLYFDPPDPCVGIDF